MMIDISRNGECVGVFVYACVCLSECVRVSGHQVCVDVSKFARMCV